MAGRARVRIRLGSPSLLAWQCLRTTIVDGFSPTDLVATGLLDCMLTTMAIIAKRENTPWGKTRGRVEKHMHPAPRRIGTLVVDLWMPSELPPDKRARMEEVANTCPVVRTLHPDVKVETRFHY